MPHLSPYTISLSASSLRDASPQQRSATSPRLLPSDFPSTACLTLASPVCYCRPDMKLGVTAPTHTNQ